MVLETEVLSDGITASYNTLLNFIPESYKMIPPLILLAIVISLYGIFIWYFYRFLAKRDIVKLDLDQYNNFEHPIFFKLFALILYVIKFVIITPLVTLFWFTIFSLMLIILAKELVVSTVILISAAVISSIRITAYFNEDLSKDLAKMFPFTLLGIVILTPGFFNFETTATRLIQLPLFFNYIVYYFLFIIVLESLLRLIFLPLILIGEDQEDKK